MESWSLKWQHVDTRCSFLPRRNSVLVISRPASWSRKSRVSDSPSGLLAVVNVTLGGSCTRVHLPVRSRWYTLSTAVVWVCYVRDYTRVLIATALGVIRGRKFRQTEIPVPINLGDVDEWGVLFSFFFFFSCGAELHLPRE